MENVWEQMIRQRHKKFRTRTDLSFELDTGEKYNPVEYKDAPAGRLYQRSPTKSPDSSFEEMEERLYAHLHTMLDEAILQISA